VGANEWSLTVTDYTANWSSNRVVTYTTPGQDAEAVHERPIIHGQLLTLAKTGNVRFTSVWVATGLGLKQKWADLGTPIPGVTLERIFMDAYKNGPVIASPSTMTLDQCFTVADGSKPPSPPPATNC
jgi:hypothetical protein